jgi:hypothetical protein
MDIHFFNGHHDPQPREKVKIEEVAITPYPDGYRVHVAINVTPFRERPNLILVIHDENDQIAAELSIIETMHFNMEFTMHLRGVDNPDGAYALSAELFYETRTPPQDQIVEGFTIDTQQEANE